MKKHNNVMVLLVILGMLSVLALSGCLPPPSAGQAEDRPMTNAEFIFMTVWFVLLSVAVYFFLVSKPRFDREDHQKKVIAELKKHDEVVTSGGIFGRVVSLRSDFITVEIAPNVRIKVKPEHIQKVAEVPGDKSAEA